YSTQGSHSHRIYSCSSFRYLSLRGGTVPLFDRILQELPVQQRLGELDAVVFEKLRIRLDAPVERHTDRPRLREHDRIVDRGLVLHVILVDQREALCDDHLAAMEVAGTVEPRSIVVRVDGDDEGIALPTAVGPSH